MRVTHNFWSTHIYASNSHQCSAFRKEVYLSHIHRSNFSSTNSEELKTALNRHVSVGVRACVCVCVRACECVCVCVCVCVGGGGEREVLFNSDFKKSAP